MATRPRSPRGKRDLRILAVTPGDPDGIGPEVVYKTLLARHGSQAALRDGAILLCIGAAEPFRKLCASVEPVTVEQVEQLARDPLARRRHLEASLKPRAPSVWLIEAPLPPKRSSAAVRAGYQAGWSIEQATRLVLARHASAIVTGPIHKERLQAGGFKFPGHTEMLSKLCGNVPVTMMLANSRLRITLATTHIAVQDVSAKLTIDRVRDTIVRTEDHMRRWFKIKRPRIGVAALNPHASENGLFGDEESRVIMPAIRAARRLAPQSVIEGPIPADTLFARHIARQAPRELPHGLYDAVVCMYHDQGLIPVKLLDFPRTVNVTLGLPIIRTSVDHGVGFDIAGKGVADPSSFASAVELALQMI